MGNEHVGMDRPYSEEVPKLSKDKLSLLQEQVNDLECQDCERGTYTRLYVTEHVTKLEERVAHLENRVELAGEMSAMALNDATELAKRVAHLEKVCEQCILEHQGRGQ